MTVRCFVVRKCLPELVNDYRRFERIKSQSLMNGRIDLSSLTWIEPATLLPLVLYMRERNELSYIPPSSESVASYINTVMTSRESTVRRYSSYIPIADLPSDRKEAENIIKRIYDLNSNGMEYGGENAFKYLIGEMVTNIYEHSMFNNALVMAQKYSKKKYVDVCFCDDGISIPGSFERAGMFFEDDFEAIGAAINGTSSKKNHERGGEWGQAPGYALKGLVVQC